MKLASKGKPSKIKYVLYAAQIAALIFLSWASVVTMAPLSYGGIPLFFFAYPFLLVFSMWWGIWGIAGAYLGGAIGGGLMVGLDGPYTAYSLAYSVSYLFPTLIAFIVYRGFLSKKSLDPLWRDLTDAEVDGTKTNRSRAWLWFILINGVALNALSAGLGVGISYQMHQMSGPFWFVWAGWFISDLTATLILVPVIAKVLAPLAKKGLANYGWIT